MILRLGTGSYKAKDSYRMGLLMTSVIRLELAT